MKNLLLGASFFALCSALNFNANAQTWNIPTAGSTTNTYIGTTSAHDFHFRTNATERMRITSAGYIGIGLTPANSYSLQIFKKSTSGFAAQTLYLKGENVSPNTDYYDLALVDIKPAAGSGIMHATYFNGSTSSELFYITTNGSTVIGNSGSSGTMLKMEGGNAILGFSSMPSTSLSGGYRFGVSGHSNFAGRVVIGTTSSFTASTPFPSGYSLYVADGVLAEKVRVAVKSTSDWSDYVFAKNYQLRSLDSVEAFINENKHLPDVPSAEEVVCNGVDLGKMDAKLLQKIEELTLYMIELKKQNEVLQKRIELIETNK